MATDQTERIPYIVSKAEKKRIAAEAKRHDLTTSRYSTLAVMWVMNTSPAKDGWLLTASGPEKQ